MRPIQVLMDEPLVKAIDKEAKRLRLNRSRIIREAVVRHLEVSRRLALEEQHRRAYALHPDDPKELEAWESIQAWPED